FFREGTQDMTVRALRLPEETLIPELSETFFPTALEGRLGDLATLEDESIFILREAAAEFSRPVMLYSVGKDSSVMLRLAQKAFYPGKIPFPLLHIDTSYKFPEMIEFRDSYTREIGAELIVHQNREALARGANPRSEEHTSELQSHLNLVCRLLLEKK